MPRPSFQSIAGIAVLALALSPLSVRAQDVKPNYALAQKYSSEFLRQFTYSTSVSPRWIGESNRFHYQYRTSAGTRYWLVDCEKRTKEPLFDHAKVAGAITQATEKAVDANDLSIGDIEFDKDGTSFKFTAGGFRFEYDRATNAVKNIGKAPRSSRNGAFPGRGRGGGGGRLTEEQMQQFLEQRRREGGRRGGGERGNGGRRGGGGFGGGFGGAGFGGAPGTAGRTYAPDRSGYVFARDHNLYFVAGKKVPVKIAKKEKPAATPAAKAIENASATSGTAAGANGNATKGAGSSASGSSASGSSASGSGGSGSGGAGSNGTGSNGAGSNGSRSNGSGANGSGGDHGSGTSGAGGSGDGDNASSGGDAPAANGAGTRNPEFEWQYDENAAVQLSKDGEADLSFGGTAAGRDGSTRSRTDRNQQDENERTRTNRGRGGRGGGRGGFGFGGSRVSWAPDSSAFYVTRRDSRGLSDLFLIDSTAEPRPTLQTYKYPMPGEERVRTTELHYYHKDSGKLVKLSPKWKDESYQGMSWDEKTNRLRFMRRDRLLRNVEYCCLDPHSGKEEVLFHEGSQDGYLKLEGMRTMEDRGEFIWWSERTGWGHYYLYGTDGKLKNAITSGSFRASSIVDLDEKGGALYFRGNGREKGENVYYEHLYRIRLDGTGLTLLDPGDATHRSSLSPSKRFVVDNWSRVDQAPGSALRDAEGNLLMQLEDCDLSRLLEVGWKLPETFKVKAADGITDLYGNMWKPFDFDPNKKYPIIANVYPGPQQEGVTHTFSAANSRQQMAQIGFIVIQVGHRGGTPQRSRAYANYGYYNLRDYGLADKKSAIEQLAMRHSFIDVNRVGIYGHSGGGFMTGAAMMQKPYNEFFKVGVASAGNHDNNIYNNSWSERYHGLKEVAADKEKTDGEGGAGAQRNGTQVDDTQRDENERDDTQRDENQRDENQRDENQTERNQTQRNGTGRNRQGRGTTERNGTGRGRTGRGGTGEQQTRTGEQRQDGGNTTGQVTKGQGTTGHGTTGQGTTGQVTKGQGTTGDTEAGSRRRRSSWRDRLAQRQEEGGSTEAKTKFEIHVPTNAELAANLKGHLLLVHGEIDNNVHPANTMRLVDALIKANKRFDMLIIPGARHSFGRATEYFNQRMWEYFAEHLLGDRQTSADIQSKK